VKLYLTALLAYLAVIFSWFSAFDCRFFTVSSPSTSSQEYQFGVGLWMQQESVSSSTCVLYDGSVTSEFDSSFRFARAISMLALVLSIPVAIMATIAIFLQSIKRSYLYAQGVIMLLLSILTSLEFVVFDSRICKNELSWTSCQLSIAGVYAIVGAVLWFLSGVSSFFVTAAEDNDGEATRQSLKQGRPVITVSEGTAESVPVTVQERRALSDGSVKVTTTTTHPDGSRTVYETLEVKEDGSMVEVPLEDLH
jgi:cation transport ATPase